MRELPKAEVSPNLDLLRAIAVLSVFVSHLLSALGISEIGSLGRFGVVIFFVHTSFVLMASLQRIEARGAGKWRMIEAFWLRRVFRIYPLAMFFVVLAAVCRIPANPGMTYNWIGLKAFLSNLALVENLTYTPDVLGPLWSLPLEVQMYVILPFAYLIVRRHSRLRYAAIWFLSVVLALTLPRLTSRFGVFICAPCFASGIVAFGFIRTRAIGARRLHYWVWPVGILLAIALFGPLDNISLRDKIYRAWILSLGLGLLYANVDEAPFSPMQRIFHWIAEHSYGIYLSHIVLIWFVLYPMASAPVWVRTLVLVVTMIAAPALLYRFIEHPLIGLGNRLSTRLFNRPRPREGIFA
jgi:peptidoglycan/LPS O-acetylase OafA/YrhL